VRKENELWYSREFTVPSSWKGKNILLHFGAVDWQADVWVNGVKMGQHRGGYTPFSFDITPVLAKGKNQITVKVWDPSDEGYQPRGKQVKHPDGIWYTPVSGIWQTVWMEPVSANHITRLKTTPDIDKKILTVEAHTATGNPSAVVSVVVSEGGKVVATGKAMQGQPVQLAIENARLWSPENPFLYDMKVTLTDNGKVIDEVNSYAAMRKYSIRQGADGITRLQLNNRNVFHFGPLDQGWWPDGLYTAPTDEALVYDIKKVKDFGYNMIRKHVKVEPARWYTHCDKLGVSYGRICRWRQRTGMAKQTIFQRSRNGPFRRIGSQLPPGMERNHRPAVFQSLCRGMGALQRMLGTIQNSRYRSLDKSLMIRVVWSILPAVEITTPAEIFSTCTIIRIPIYISTIRCGQPY